VFTSGPGPVPGGGAAKSKAFPLRAHAPEKSGTAGFSCELLPAPVRAKAQNTASKKVPAGRNIPLHRLVRHTSAIGFLSYSSASKLSLRHYCATWTTLCHVEHNRSEKIASFPMVAA
jgi:hypothetical protein